VGTRWKGKRKEKMENEATKNRKAGRKKKPIL
jgi:hypothetical protein